MKKDLLLTFFAEAVVLVSGLLVYKFAANLVGQDAFSQYALCRRTVSFILPALLMGLTVGIPRYIAFASSNNDYQRPDNYFLSGIVVLFINVLLFMLVLNLFKRQFACLFFGSSEYHDLIFSISIMIIGLTLHAACYSYYRGNLLMIRANILQVLNTGVVPVLVFVTHADIVRILSLTGLSWIITSAFALALICKNLEWNKTKSLLPCAKELLSYGIQRVPGDFGMAALLSLPAILTSHTSGIRAAGYVAFGTTILNMTGSVFAPFGLVLLPKASQLIASRNMVKLKDYILKLAGLTLLLSLVGLIVFEIFAYEIIKIYLGETFNDLVVIARIIMLGSLAYTYYVSMRSIVDAFYFKAVNTLNIIIALFIFLIVSGFVCVLDGSNITLVSSFVGSLYVLGILTFINIRKLLRST